jgi:hypothetical protein
VMERRVFLALVPGRLLAAPLAAVAQQAAKIARIGLPDSCRGGHGPPPSARGLFQRTA